MSAASSKNRRRKPGISMTLDEVMIDLQDCGTEQNIKIYKRHGAPEPMFGVSFANITRLTKSIKIDHDLGLQLWATGNMDAQTLATKIMDPKQISAEQVGNMLAGITYYMLINQLVAELIMPNDYAEDLMQEWLSRKEECYQRAAYSILANLARRQDSLDDTVFRHHLSVIERDIHQAPNRAKQMMNIAMLNIGIRPGALYKEALATAQRVGPVEVDHGDTSCKTYDSASMLADETYLARARKSLKWKK